MQASMDAMIAADLALSTMRARPSTLSSFCARLVKRGLLNSNPVAKMVARRGTFPCPQRSRSFFRRTSIAW